MNLSLENKDLETSARSRRVKLFVRCLTRKATSLEWGADWKDDVNLICVMENGNEWCKGIWDALRSQVPRQAVLVPEQLVTKNR
jgi:hypothetical protein